MSKAIVIRLRSAGENEAADLIEALIDELHAARDSAQKAVTYLKPLVEDRDTSSAVRDATYARHQVIQLRDRAAAFLAKVAT